MRLVCIAATVAMACGICVGGETTSRPASGVVLREDAPTTAPAAEGQLRGRIVVPADAGGTATINLRAISRVTGKTYKPASFDASTGSFVFKALPGGARYDICFSAGEGREIEGIDLDFVDHRLVRLAANRRKELALPAERNHSFSQQDVKALQQYVKEMDDFMEQRRVLYIRGHGRRATLLVELMRTREFYAAKDQELIWRIELWYFVNEFGGWDKLPNQERVLRRVRIGADKWRTISLEYYPQLSVYVSPEGKAPPVEFKAPRKPDSSRGRVAGTEAGIMTQTHVSGLAEKAPGEHSNDKKSEGSELGRD